uniref:Cation/H+ exchanger domain-containing protein n=1 Tax=Panagrolaimus superbus TaxID=310955 RepID=A0A914Y635_9BILA
MFVNLILTSFVIFASIYFILISLFHRNILHPFKEERFGIHNIAKQGNNITERIDPPKYGDINSIFSIFILWIFALIFGKLVAFLYLPPLLGQLIAGILFSNISFFHQFLLIDKEWEAFLRQTAFIWILIRASFGLKHHILKKNLFTCASLGFVTTLIEVITIAVVSGLLFGLPAYIGLAFGFVLASTSPAVTVPVMIKLQNEDRGTSKGIPTVILASATLDNLFCITCFYILMATFNAKIDDSLVLIIVKIIVEIILATFIGGIFGVILWLIPSKNIAFYHFSRFIIAVLLSLGFYFITYSHDLLIAGPLIVCIICAIASFQWKRDNHHGTAKEEHALHISWIIFFQPLLFAFIGVFFDFSVFTWKLLFDALTILGIGLLF